MKKFLSILTLLLAVCSGAWADGYYTPTVDEVIILNDVYSSTETGCSSHSAVAWGGTGGSNTSSKKAGDPDNGGAATSDKVTLYAVKGGNTTNKQITVSISGCSKLTVYHESRNDRMFLANITPSAGAASTASSSASTYYTEIELDGTKSYTLVFHGYNLNSDTGSDFYLYAFKLTKYVARTISTEELDGVKYNNTALTKDATTNGYSVSGTTVTLSDDLVAYAAPTTVTLTNHITYTDKTTEDKNVAVTFDGTVTSGYYIGSAAIGETTYTVRMKQESQTVTAVTINGSAISAADLATLTSTKSVSIDGSALNGIGMINVTLSGGTTTVTRTFSGDDVTYAFTLNGSDNYTVTFTGVKKTYTAIGDIVYYKKGNTEADGVGTNSLTANGINFSYSSKTFGYGDGNVTIGSDVYQPIKLSTGEAVTVTFPAGKKATKVRVYGWCTDGSNGRLSTFKEASDSEKDLSSTSNANKFYANNVDGSIYPSVYEYELDNWESMYFQGSGAQPFIVMDFEFKETVCAVPVITPADGSTFSTASQEVTISCSTDGATVYYTTDGTEPTASSTQYTAAFTISSTTTVKAIAIKSGLDNSNVATATIKKNVSSVVGNWDFTAWSTETQAGVLADETNWYGHEKTGDSGTDFTLEAQLGRANKLALDAGELKYGETTIPETTGLKFTAPAATSEGKNFALLFNMPSLSSMGEYDGGQFIWLFSSDAKIIIPSISKGSVVSVDVESHKTGTNVSVSGDARGLTVKVGSTTLTQTEGEATTTTTKATMTWTVTADGDVTIAPKGKGVHIYKITVISNVETVPVTTNCEGGLATFASTKILDLSNLPEGVKAYKVSSATSSSAKLEEVNVAVPAGTGLIFKGTKGATYNIPVAASASELSDNLLIGVTAVDGYTVAADEVYALSKSDGLLHPVAEGVTIPAGKAYLPAGNISGARAIALVFDDESTGIAEMQAVKNVENGKFYNLNGQQVAQPTKGLYIVNGRKVVVK
ncbi:MAG: chitobiase/beta-hexosaminidase C-terminal domain-containing protein [Bacteroidaceae bacterium]|nr:chitobiase/beta-hexosaminidase C-terminal domain-containing protein [Bacteroidaceae bacterium]